MKKVSITFTIVLFLSFICQVSSGVNLSLEDYCKKTYQNRKLSHYSIKNKGKFRVKKRRTGQKIPRSISKYYRGCRADTPWLEEVYNTVCSKEKVNDRHIIDSKLSHILVPSSFLFYFAGAGDFNARRAKSEFDPINLDSSEGNDLGMGNYNGASVLRSALKGSRNELYDSPELHYHASSGFHRRENFNSAIACAKEIKDNLDIIAEYGNQDVSNKKWVSLGYSNGGALAIDFQNTITNYQIEMDLVITIDPIVQTLIFPVHGFKSMIGKRNSKTKRFINLYQDSDIDTLPLVSLRGKPVEEADLNLLISANDESSGLNKSGRYNHMSITSIQLVEDLISSEIDDLLE